MRVVALLGLVLPMPVQAWEFSPVPICTLSQTEPSVETVVTYDPATGDYAIALTLSAGTWPRASVFGIRFEGARPNLIVTERHVLSDGDMTLTVTDRGFGNVLGGMEANDRAVALTGDLSIVVALDGAAGPVAEFRACIAAPSV